MMICNNSLILAMNFIEFNDKGQVTIGSSIFVSIFSMAVVFIILLIISYMIDLQHLLLDKTNHKKVVVKENTNIDTKIDNSKDETTLVAIITAAIASYLGTSNDKIHIKSIKRVNQNKSLWQIKNSI